LGGAGPNKRIGNSKLLKLTFYYPLTTVGISQEETYALSSVKTLDEAVKNIIQYLGLQPCERSDKIQEGKSSHTLFLAGNLSLFLSLLRQSFLTF
jgi:hypothetical protein